VKSSGDTVRTGRSGLPRILETTALLILLGIVVLRPLISESYESVPSAMSQALGEVSDPSPLRTLVFDGLILVAACLWLLARAIGSPHPYRWSGLEWGGVLIAVAMIASCVTAGNKRLAVDAGIDWLCNPILAIVLVQLLRTERLRRVMLAAVLASACVQVVQCLDQSFWGFDDSWRHYQSIKADFWAKQGVALDSSKVTLFEHRMLSREAQGFFPHANVAASYLSVCGLAAMGLALAGLKRIKNVGVSLADLGVFLAAILILAAVLTTKSLGATVSVVVVSLVGLLCWRLRDRIAAAPKRFVSLIWSIVWVVAAATIAYGRIYNRLPGWSLTFRWQYWTASAKMFADHWLTGVGRENFGRHYLQYKSIQSPEEIANPHNLFVQAACDFGVVGAIGIVVLLAGWSWVLAGKRRQPLNPPSPPETGGLCLLWTVALLGVVTLGRMPLLGTDNWNFLYYQTVVTGAVFLVAFRLFLAATPSADAALAGVVAGIAAFLIHDTINFAAFVPATATTLFALMAWAVASRQPEVPQTSHPTPHTPFLPWLAFTIVAMCLGMVLLTAVIPVARCQAFMDRARTELNQPLRGPIGDHPAWQALQAAAGADLWDPTPHRAQAEWALSVAKEAPLSQQESLLRTAYRKSWNAGLLDRADVQTRRLEARILLECAHASRSAGSFAEAISSTRRVLYSYPQSPNDWVHLGEVQLEAAETNLIDGQGSMAASSFQRALDLDDQRLPWEEFHRFSEAEREAIRMKIEQARQ